MANDRRALAWWPSATGLALILAPVLVQAGPGAGPGAGGRVKVVAEADAELPADLARQRREAREIIQALRETHEALQREGQEARSGKGGGPQAAPPARPARSGKTPTLDAEALDALIEKSLAGAKAPPARRTDDEEFLRRVYLDVTGKLPTPEEIVRFARSRDKHKRGKLIDQLLESPDYAANWAHYWRDVVRFHAANANPAQVRYDRLEEWLTEQLAENRPWDEIATELITAKGRNDENGAVVFTIAQMAQPVELAGEVSRVFLGVQIQCAQCHDHPTDPWKREQFHQFAAFFAGARARRAAAKADEGEAAGKAKTKARAKGQAQGPPAFEVVTQGRPRYAMPDLKDPQKQIPVSPRFFLASAGDVVPEGLSADERRALVASYITGQDNPWFAKAFVNRVWYALMGEGFYDPVDDLGPTRTPNAPEVLEALASQWQQGGYDIRWLFRTILNTKAYQREARASNLAAGRAPFASNCPSRLRSDQILDALAHALNLPLDGGAGRGPGAKEEAKGPRRARGNPRRLFNVLFGVDPSTPSDEVLGTIPQALFLMNSPQVNRAIAGRPDTVLGEILAAAPDDRAALEALYLRVLARQPNAREASICGRHLRAIGDRREAFEDILWSLINSTEFISRR